MSRKNKFDDLINKITESPGGTGTLIGDYYEIPLVVKETLETTHIEDIIITKTATKLEYFSIFDLCRAYDVSERLSASPEMASFFTYHAIKRTIKKEETLERLEKEYREQIKPLLKNKKIIN